MNVKNKLIPELRFPEFNNKGEWNYENGNIIFEQISNKNHNSDLPILAITQEYGAIPRDKIEYSVIVSDKGIEGYKVVEVGDFIISLRSFQGGIEYSNYKGLCSPAYIVLRKKKNVSNDFYRHYFKSKLLIKDLNKNLEGIRDGKMVSFKQFSEILLPNPKKDEQQKIADCLSSLDELIYANNNKLETLKEHKKGLMQNLFPAKGETIPKLRFKEFENDGEWKEWIVSEIGETINGLTGKRGEDFGRGNPYVTYKQVFDDSIIEFDKCSKVQIGENENQNYLQRGDILLTTSSETPNEVGFASVIVNSPNEKTYLNSFCFALRPFDLDITQPQFSRYLFHSNMYRSSITALAQGSTRYNISKNAFLKLKLLIPAKKEQQRIASCLNALDDMIIAQTEKTEQLKEYKKGLIQGLFPIIN